MDPIDDTKDTPSAFASEVVLSGKKGEEDPTACPRFARKFTQTKGTSTIEEKSSLSNSKGKQ